MGSNQREVAPSGICTFYPFTSTARFEQCLLWSSFFARSLFGCSLPCLCFTLSSLHTHVCLYPNTQVHITTLPKDEGKIDFKRQKSALPKLHIKGGDATSTTRTTHEWLQKTSIALNTWSACAVQLWHNAVALAKAARQQWTMMAPSQRGLQTGLPSTGTLPAQFSRVYSPV